MVFHKTSLVANSATFGAGLVINGSRVEAFQIYALSSVTPGGDNPTRFGFIDSDTGIYTTIASLNVSPIRNLASRDGSFFTSRCVNVNDG